MRPPAYLIERYAASRRRATLVACLIDLEERLTDAAIEMADKLIGTAFSRAKNTQARRYAATSKDVARLMRLFRGTIDALSLALNNDSDPIDWRLRKFAHRLKRNQLEGVRFVEDRLQISQSR